MRVHIEGLEELIKGLETQGKMEKVKQVVKLNGAELQANAMRKAPVAAVNGGTLKRSIGLDMEDGGMTAVVEAKAEYAPYQEFGTRFMGAQPYMGPAFNQQKGRFLNDLQRLQDA